MIAIDTNVVVYAHRAETELHEVAPVHLTRLCEGCQPRTLTATCLSELFRVVINPKVFNPTSKHAVTRHQ